MEKTMTKGLSKMPISKPLGVFYTLWRLFYYFSGLFPNIPKTQNRKEGCEMDYRIVRNRRGFTIIFSFFFLFLFPILLHASIFTVNNTADKVDANPGDGLCSDDIGNCTLRAAIQEANSLEGADTVNIPTGIYVLTIQGIGENAAATGDLDITDEITITGAGAANTVIDGN